LAVPLRPSPSSSVIIPPERDRGIKRVW
jgi:hypothetical protein